MRAMLVAMAMVWAGTAMAQGLPGLPGLGGGAAETPEQKRAFCQRVAGAAGRCALSGGFSLDMVALSGCLIRSLAPQDSLRVAMAANAARGNAGALLSQCGVGATP